MLVKCTICLLLLGVIQRGSTQAVQLQNLSGQSLTDHYVFIGIANKFLILPPKKVNSVWCSTCKWELISDTLFIEPTVPGKLQLQLGVEGGTVDKELEAGFLPEFFLTMDSHEPGTIFQTRLKRGQVFKPFADEKTYWSLVRVNRFTASINNQVFYQNGNEPTIELYNAIAQAPKGTRIHITALEVVHRNGQRHLLPTYNVVIQ